jgi:hypothetical protein
VQSLRSVAAVILGLAFMLSFAGIVAPVLGRIVGIAGFLMANVMSAVIGGWLTARIAGYAELAHAAGLAAIIAIGTIVAASAPLPAHQPGWYVPVAGLIGIAGVLFGGWLRSAAALAARP